MRRWFRLTAQCVLACLALAGVPAMAEERPPTEAADDFFRSLRSAFNGSGMSFQLHDLVTSDSSATTAGGRKILQGITCFLNWGAFRLDLSLEVGQVPGAHQQCCRIAALLASELEALGADMTRVRFISRGRPAYPAARSSNVIANCPEPIGFLDIAAEPADFPRKDRALLGSGTRIEARAWSKIDQLTGGERGLFVYLWLRLHGDGSIRRTQCRYFLRVGGNRAEVIMTPGQFGWLFNEERNDILQEAIAAKPWDGDCRPGVTRVRLMYEDEASQFRYVPGDTVQVEVMMRDLDSLQEVTIITPPVVIVEE